ncbi:MAG: aspartate racemase [Candidatus Peregrinibacteria bacterium Greene0416_19]|nr:MAG: aspartate racemase [Candidatus Peregrinibacteria bacterium Greene0416_19]
MIHASPPTIGIIGGFGPDTSAAFCARIVQHAHASKPEHSPAFVVDFVSVPPDIASKAIAGSRAAGKILVAAVNDSIRRLHTTGVRSIALPCNTLHLFADDFVLPSPLRLLHIVDAVLLELKHHHVKRIGLLATGLTVSSGLYSCRCRRQEVQCFVPSVALQRRLNKEITHFVSTGSVSDCCTTTFAAIFQECGNQEVSAVVLGCTDLGGMLERCGLACPLVCIDSMDVLAKACARHCV